MYKYFKSVYRDVGHRVINIVSRYVFHLNYDKIYLEKAACDGSS